VALVAEAVVVAQPELEAVVPVAQAVVARQLRRHPVQVPPDQLL